MQVNARLTPPPSAAPQSGTHLAVLDGWRGISILLVLAAHLLPLGPKAWNLNEEVGILGMVIFFNLSGFLITSFLLKETSVASFLVRRFCRVVPLAWLYLAVALLVSGAAAPSWFAHFLFYANLPPKELVALTDHIWSLCVEMQFYVGVAVLVAALRARGLLLLPLFCLFFTGLRVWNGVHASSVSYYRIDEILAGCTLALAYHGRLGPAWRAGLARLPQLPLLALLVLSCMQEGGWLNYLRPYFAAALVGATILAPDARLAGRLKGKVLFFVAGISYALYVLHPMLAATWLGSGTGWEKYEKRPLLFAALFLLAYLSTHYYESRFIEYGRNLTRALRPSAGLR